jgi:hypothetical protein
VITLANPDSRRAVGNMSARCTAAGIDGVPNASTLQRRHAVGLDAELELRQIRMMKNDDRIPGLRRD